MNKNLNNVEISGIRKFYNEVQKVEGAISLTLGQPDFKIPKSIESGLINAIKDGKTTYTSNNGIYELRKEISSYLKELNIKYHEDEICITVGGSEGLFSIFTALLNEGDKVLIPTPAYPAYESIVKLLGGQVVNYNLNLDFSLNIQEVEKLIVENNIKYMILSLPSNPTGSILSKKERDLLIRIIEKHNIIVITDEIYEAICFEEYYSIAQVERIRNKIIYVSGFSKMFSMTGLRVGYICAPHEIMKEIMKVHQYNVTCATSISQWAVYEGLLHGKADIKQMKDTFKLRKEYIVSNLKEMGLEVVEPKGSFYVFPSIKKFNMTSNEFSMRLLNEKKLACVPGDAFGKGGEGYIRISYCYSNEELEEAMKRLREFINELEK